MYYTCILFSLPHFFYLFQYYLFKFFFVCLRGYAFPRIFSIYIYSFILYVLDKGMRV